MGVEVFVGLFPQVHSLCLVKIARVGGLLGVAGVLHPVLQFFIVKPSDILLLCGL